MEIIAEIAQGFEGKHEQAALLMRAAHSAGADAVKYHLVYADELATEDYKHFKLFQSLEMEDNCWLDLADHAKELGIKFQLDILGLKSLDLALRLGVDAVKLHPTDIANIVLLKEVARSRVPKVLLGAGGAHMGELTRALDLLGAMEVVVILGFQAYPTPTETNQIARIRFLVEKLGRSHPHVEVGFADHALPDSPLRYALAATAVGTGARVIEKHLTLGQVMKLEDHESALNPDDFAEFVQVLQACSVAIGVAAETEDLGMSESEKGYRKMIRRHVVTARSLTKGTQLSLADLALKRTSLEQPITELCAAYGKYLSCDKSENSPLSTNDLL